jgi:hypothetical protein
VADPDLDAAVHKSVHDALLDVADAQLRALIGTRVYDRVPGPAPAYPYVVIDRIEVGDDSNSCSDASIVHVTVRAISNAYGSIEAKQIGGLIRRALGRPLPIAGHQVSVGAFDAAVYRPSDSPLNTEGVITTHYLVDPL